MYLLVIIVKYIVFLYVLIICCKIFFLYNLISLFWILGDVYLVLELVLKVRWLVKILLVLVFLCNIVMKLFFFLIWLCNGIFWCLYNKMIFIIFFKICWFVDIFILCLDDIKFVIEEFFFVLMCINLLLFKMYFWCWVEFLCCLVSEGRFF